MDTELFIEIFTGLQRNFGAADMTKVTITEEGKKKPKYEWTHREITKQDYIDHLNGVKAIGIQPVNDEGMCRFAAIDIDDKQYSYKNFPYKTFLELIAKYNLPIVPVKSKSGGLHLYVFTKEPVKATFLRGFLEKLLLCLSLPANIEIYPMQTELLDVDGKKDNGRFINLPYFNKNQRVCLSPEGKEYTFEQFMKVLELNRYSKEELEEFADKHVKEMLTGGAEEFEDGPPCLQILTKQKLSDGRDRFLYNYMIFAKKKFTDNWEKEVKRAARDYFEYDSDWDDKKVDQKIKAWKKDTKGYTCNEDPIFAVCQRAVCRTRKFGILSDKKKSWPEMTNLIKINYQPDPQYTFDVHCGDGKIKQVRVPNQNFFYNKLLMKGVITKFTDIHLADIPPFQFNDTMAKLFPPKVIYEPPKSATLEGMFEEHLKEHINGQKAKSATSFKNGAVLIHKDTACFKITKFHNELKNKEIKMTMQETIKYLEDHFGAQLKMKRFPKKEGDSKEHNPIQIVELQVSKKLQKNEEVIELLKMQKKDDIF